MPVPKHWLLGGIHSWNDSKVGINSYSAVYKNTRSAVDVLHLVIGMNSFQSELRGESRLSYNKTVQFYPSVCERKKLLHGYFYTRLIFIQLSKSIQRIVHNDGSGVFLSSKYVNCTITIALRWFMICFLLSYEKAKDVRIKLNKI